MITIKINGTDMSQYLKSKSLKIDMDSSHYKTCSLTLTSITITQGVPEEGKILEVYYSTSLLFQGVIDSKDIKQLSPNSDRLEVNISSNGFRYVPYRRTTSEIFNIEGDNVVGDDELGEYMTAGYVVKYFINHYLNAEGITYADVGILEGKRYRETQNYICMSIGEILDQLATDSNAHWYINPSKVFYFIDDYYTFEGEEWANIEIENPIQVDFRNPQLKTSLSDYANKVFFKGDLDDGYDTDGNPINVHSQSDSEIAHMASLDGGSGVYGISVSNSNIKTIAEAQTYCDKILAKRISKPKILTFDTTDWQTYQVGQKQNINLPTLGINTIEGECTNYVVEKISLTDMGNQILTKKVEMRQLFPTGGGVYTWSKSAQGATSFQKLTQSVKQAEKKAQDIVKNHLYVENLRGGTFSTQNFDGTGDYIQLQKQFMTFWDSSTHTVKMAFGFIPNTLGYAVPGIAFGAGDGHGNNRGFIQKDTDGLSMFYVGNLANNEVGFLKVTKDNVYINDLLVPKCNNNGQLVDGYISSASGWNDKLSQMVYNDTTGATAYTGQVAKSTTETDTYLDISGDYGDMTLYYLGDEWFKIQNDYDALNMYAFGDNFLGYNRNQQKTYPKGSWDFSNCTASNANLAGLATTTNLSSYVTSSTLSTTLSSYSTTSHNHSSLYAATNHNHTGAYATTTHNHDGIYVKVGYSQSNLVMYYEYNPSDYSNYMVFYNNSAYLGKIKLQ